MHKFMRAIGFSQYTDRVPLKELLSNTISHADHRGFTLNEDGVFLGEFCKNYTSGEDTGDVGRFGVAVCGEFDENEKFIYDYYFPYLCGSGITSLEDVSVERHAANDSYAGVCDDMKLGISLIFYLRNRIPYIKLQSTEKLPVRGTSLTLSGLSLGGSILLPIRKDEVDVERTKRNMANRTKLLQAAKQGDEDAIETLTLEDMDVYSAISRRIQDEDVYSLVDTSFMPYGVECDQYSVLGEITEIHLVTNSITGEKVYILGIITNDLAFDICINAKDLYGEPKVGRRFKGMIWLQGYINFPQEVL